MSRQPLESHIADSDNLELLARIHGILGSNVESEALAVLAEQPRLLEGFWSAFAPALRCSIVRSAAREIRRTADSLAKDNIDFPDHLCWLSANAIGREDSRQIRYVVEAFASLEPVFAVIAAAAARWLRSGSLGFWGVRKSCEHPEAVARFTGGIRLVKSPRGARTMGSLLDELGRPAHPLTRALAVWPTYQYKVFSDLGPRILGEWMPEPVGMLRRTIELLTASLPASYHRQDGDTYERFAAKMDACLDASLSATLLVTALRQGFIEAEVTARNTNTSALARLPIQSRIRP